MPTELHDDIAALSARSIKLRAQLHRRLWLIVTVTTPEGFDSQWYERPDLRELVELQARYLRSHAYTVTVTDECRRVPADWGGSAELARRFGLPNPC